MSEKVKKVMHDIELEIERYEEDNGGADDVAGYSEIEELLEEEQLEDEIEIG
ncbi:MAG: hypothetical protein HFH36_09080 [Lachnospiraceae bacterium]|nr:hypothetical protein [Lachnospiraceae bacterium]